jgi:hypothetical protein
VENDAMPQDNDVQMTRLGLGGLTRRGLLGATLGGFALGSGGLLLPRGIAEVRALEGSLGGEKGGRRGKDRRGRDPRRNHRDRNRKNRNRNNPPGQGLLKNLAFSVVNASTSESLEYVLLSNFTRDGFRRVDERLPPQSYAPLNDIKDDEGWFFLPESVFYGNVIGTAIYVSNPTFGAVWYRVYLNLALSQLGLDTWINTRIVVDKTTIEEGKAVELPKQGTAPKNLVLSRGADDRFKNLTLTFSGRYLG